MLKLNKNEVERSEFFDNLFAEAEKREEFHAAGVKIEIAEQIYRLMEAQNINQSELARRIGKSRAYVSKMLSGKTNFTMETLITIGEKLGAEWNFQLVEFQKSVKKAFAMEYDGSKLPINVTNSLDNFYHMFG
jgi:transcriptional regulator with XRE-family HTH domain